jgi:hypothetical protein
VSLRRAKIDAWVSRFPKGHHNPHDNAVVRLRVGRHAELETPSGSEDDVSAWRDVDSIYLLTVNHGLPYVGLDEYLIQADDDEHESAGGEESYPAIDPSQSVFLQEGRTYETLGEDWEKLSERELVKKLMEYLG